MNLSKKKILFVFGTRPEAIKMAPLIKNLSDIFKTSVCVTAQHREMLDDVLETFDITPKYDLDLMKPGQDLFNITTEVLNGIKSVLEKENPDLLLVHGDTTTTFSSSLAAFYFGCPVGHIEAGLRTYNLYSPYPEELNRQIVTKLTKYHFCPTLENKQNLLSENIDERNIIVTGNTVIDALLVCAKSLENQDYTDELNNQLSFVNDNDKKIILVTGHRRENFGEGFKNICKGILKIAKHYPDIEIVYPVHMKYLRDQKNINLIKPQPYKEFVQLMMRSYLILTDSGGIQEEAPSLNKPVLVLRDTSERMEAVRSGAVKIVGTNSERIFNETKSLIDNVQLYSKMTNILNPYGNGTASDRIRAFLEKELK